MTISKEKMIIKKLRWGRIAKGFPYEPGPMVSNVVVAEIMVVSEEEICFVSCLYAMDYGLQMLYVTPASVLDILLSLREDFINPYCAEEAVSGISTESYTIDDTLPDECLNKKSKYLNAFKFVRMTLKYARKNSTIVFADADKFLRENKFEDQDLNEMKFPLVPEKFLKVEVKLRCGILECSFELRDRIVFVSDPLGIVKAGIFKIMTFYGGNSKETFITMGSDAVSDRGRWDFQRILEDTRNGLIVINNPDYILTDKMREQIIEDKSNQYMIFTEDAYGFDPQKEQCAKLVVNWNKCSLGYLKECELC